MCFGGCIRPQNLGRLSLQSIDMLRGDEVYWMSSGFAGLESSRAPHWVAYSHISIKKQERHRFIRFNSPVHPGL